MVIFGWLNKSKVWVGRTACWDIHIDAVAVLIILRISFLVLLAALYNAYCFCIS